MARTRNVEFDYASEVDDVQEGAGIKRSGVLVILNDSDEDWDASVRLGTLPLMIKVRGERSGEYQTVAAVGQEQSEDGQITPFANRQLGQERANKINELAENIRRPRRI